MKTRKPQEAEAILMNVNFKIEACEKSYLLRDIVKAEENESINSVQQLTISEPIKQEEEISKIVSEVVDSHCAMCDRTFRSTSTYTSHVKKYHNLRIEEGIKPVDDLFNHNPLNEGLNNANNLEPLTRHSRRKRQKITNTDTVEDEKLHESQSSTENLLENHYSKKDSSIEPDPDKPNFYCRSCNFTYASHSNYRKHLCRSHKLYLAPLIAKRDPNLFCHSCNFTFATRSGYQRHLGTAHSMDTPRLKTRRKIINTFVEPDPNDPNFFCRSCTSTSVTRSGYLRYLQMTTHSMDVPNLKKCKKK